MAEIWRKILRLNSGFKQVSLFRQYENESGFYFGFFHCYLLTKIKLKACNYIVYIFHVAKAFFTAYGHIFVAFFPERISYK